MRTVIALSLLLTLLPNQISADTCTSIWNPLSSGNHYYVCGKAINNTPYPMRYTINPDSSSTTPYPTPLSLCATENWSNSVGPNAVSKLVRCKQDPLPAHSSKGGNTCDASKRVDVDAVTFAERDFKVVYWENDGLARAPNPQYAMKRGR